MSRKSWKIPLVAALAKRPRYKAALSRAYNIALDYSGPGQDMSSLIYYCQVFPVAIASTPLVTGYDLLSFAALQVVGRFIFVFW